MARFITTTIILILWFACSIISYAEVSPFVKDLNKSDRRLVEIIFIVGGPFFVIVTALEAILNSILPDDWGGDNSWKC